MHDYHKNKELKSNYRKLATKEKKLLSNNFLNLNQQNEKIGNILKFKFWVKSNFLKDETFVKKK